MPGFKNFKIWHGRLPHWRADDVVYYVTFRHRRDLAESERQTLLKELIRPSGWDLLIACVLPSQTEVMFRTGEGKDGQPKEFAEIVEKAKGRAGKKIGKQTAERFPPFYFESYDRIVRNEAEYTERWQAILASPCDLALAEQPDEYPALYLALKR